MAAGVATPPRRRRSTLLVGALVCACAAATATAKTIKVTATSCAGIGAAVAQLNEAYGNATSSAPISLMITLDCAGSFECNSTSDFGAFQASTAPTKNGKQPKVKITLAAGSRCRKGASRPVIGVTLPALQNNVILQVSSTDYPRTSVQVTVTGVRLYSNVSLLSLVEFIPYANTSSSLTMKDCDIVGGLMYIGYAHTATITGAFFSYPISYPLEVEGITRSITIKNSVFNLIGGTATDGPGAAWMADFAPKAKVTMSGNRFNSSTPSAGALAVALRFNGDVSASLGRNNFINNNNVASFPTAICITNDGTPAKPPRISVAGSTGLSPTKPGSNKTAPWPTVAGCNTAAFEQVGP